MTTQRSNSSRNAAAAAVAAAALNEAARADSVAEIEALVKAIQSSDEQVRGDAWQGAAKYGAPAIQPLAVFMTDENFEAARSAKRAIWKIVRYAGRPGATNEATAVELELIVLTEDPRIPVKRESIWMLSEIGTDVCVERLAVLLENHVVRDDARMALQRIPGEASLKALQLAFQYAPNNFKHNLAEALEKRGHPAAGYPSLKKIPTKKTTVEPIN